jgi:glycosyltransferase involved in cell wall biosynthesis
MTDTFQQPLVSVVIPVFNGTKYIIPTVESVLHQTYNNYEIIIIDDGSTDQLKELLDPYLKKYSPKIKYFYQNNQGLSAARNQGIKLSNGELIALLDADDLFYPDKLTEQVAIFQNNPQIGLVQSGWELIDEHDNFLSQVKLWEKSPHLDLKDWLLWQATLPSAMVFQKTWLEKIGGFNPQLRKMEDLDIALRFALAGGQATWLEKIAVAYRQHSHNLSKDRVGYTQILEELLDDFFALNDLPDDIRAIEKNMRYNCLIWNCWRLYQSENYGAMTTYLEKSLQYSNLNIRDTIQNWLANFINFHQQNPETKFYLSALLNLPEWQVLIEKILPNDQYDQSLKDHDQLFNHHGQPAQIAQLEKSLNYHNYLWNAWESYQQNSFDLMQNYLQKSLTYSDYEKIENITHWIGRFHQYATDQKINFDAYKFSQLSQWQNLIKDILHPHLPKVSVIIATYNNSQYITEAINSVLNQTYTAYEIIIIDDGSTDNTAEVLQPYLDQYQDQIKYYYQTNQGVSKARNFGIEIATGEYVVFLDADDLFLPDKLASQVAVFQAKPYLGIVHSGWRLIKESGEKISDVKLWQYGHSLEIDLETWVVWKPVTISLMFKNSWLQNFGGFDTRWTHGEDIDLIMRLSLNGCRAQWLPKVTYCYRQHERNATRKSRQQTTTMMAMLDNFFSLPNLPLSVKNLEEKSRYYTLTWLAWQAHRNNNLNDMKKLLYEALNITPLSPSETLFHWIDSFTSLYEQYGDKLDVYSFTNSPEWQELTAGLMAIHNS